MFQTASFLKTYLYELTALLEAVDPVSVEKVVDVLYGAWRDESLVLLMGNGGSSSSVSHIVCDLQKNIQIETGRALRTLCLTDSTPLLSAWANDTHWDNVFAPQVACWAKPGDVVIGVSGSGNSMNVINGMTAARASGARTIGFAGYEGGKLKDVSDTCIVVRSDNMQRIEDVHMTLLHAVFLALYERAKSSLNFADPSEKDARARLDPHHLSLSLN